MPVKKCVRCPQIAIGVRSWNWLTPFLIPRINNETMTSLKLACKQISPTMNFFSQGILQLFDYTTTDHCEFWGYLAEWPRSIVLLPDPKTPNPSDENAPLPRPDAWPNLATRQANFLLIWSTFLKFSVKTSLSCQKSDVHVRWQSHHYHCNQLAKSFPAWKFGGYCDVTFEGWAPVPLRPFPVGLHGHRMFFHLNVAVGHCQVAEWPNLGFEGLFLTTTWEQKA